MYSESEKAIFSFFHPERNKTVFADPLVLDMRIRKASEAEDMDSVYKAIDSEVEDLYENGIQRLLPILYTAFGLKPVNEDDGSGTPAEIVLRIYSEYMTFKVDVKKNTDPSPSSSPLTDGPLDGSPALPPLNLMEAGPTEEPMINVRATPAKPIPNDDYEPMLAYKRDLAPTDQMATPKPSGV